MTFDKCCVCGETDGNMLMVWTEFVDLKTEPEKVPISVEFEFFKCLSCDAERNRPKIGGDRSVTLIYRN